MCTEEKGLKTLLCFVHVRETLWLQNKNKKEVNKKMVARLRGGVIEMLEPICIALTAIYNSGHLSPEEILEEQQQACMSRRRPNYKGPSLTPAPPETPNRIYKETHKQRDKIL